MKEHERAREIGERLSEMDQRAVWNKLNGLDIEDPENHADHMIYQLLEGTRVGAENKLLVRQYLIDHFTHMNTARQQVMQGLADALEDLLDAYKAVCGVDPNCDCRQCSAVVGARAALAAAKPFLTPAEGS